MKRDLPVLLAILAIAASAAVCQGQLVPVTPYASQYLSRSLNWSSAPEEWPDLSALQAAPLSKPESWQNARIVKLRNSAGPGGNNWLSGSIVKLPGESSARHVLTCGHGLEGIGDPVLVIFHDGSTQIGVVVGGSAPMGGQGAPSGPDFAYIELQAPRQEFYELATSEPQPGSEAWVCGFPHAEALRQRAGRFRLANSYASVVSGGAIQGESGGAVLNSQGQLIGVISSTDGRDTYCCRLPVLRQLLANLFTIHRQPRLPPSQSPSQPPNPAIPPLDSSAIESQIADIRARVESTYNLAVGLRGTVDAAVPRIDALEAQPGCDCEQELANIRAHFENQLDAVVSQHNQQLQQMHAQFEQRLSNISGGDPNLALEVNRLRSDVAALQNREINLEIYRGGELAGVSSGKSTVRFNVDDLLKK